VVGLNAAVIGLIAWGLARAWAAGGFDAPSAGLPAVVAALLLGGIATAAVQARYGSRSAVSGLDPEAVDGGGPRDLAARVTRLAKGADVPPPSVAVAERAEPCCLTVDRGDAPTVVVTTGLLERLDDDELDAALAHEIAHLANRDLPLASAVAATLSITDRLLEREGRLRVILYNVGVIAAVTGVGVLVLALPIAVLAVVVLVLSVVARSLLALNAVALRTFARTREYAADRGAAALTDPASLAAALRTLENERPGEDLRMTASATLGIVHRPLSLGADVDDETEDGEGFVERFLLDPDEDNAESAKWKADPEEPDPAPVGEAMAWAYRRTVARVVSAVRRALRWRPSTHPPTDERLARLRALEAGDD